MIGQELRESIDVAERRAQVVRDGIGERLQLLVGGLQLRRAVSNALFQLFVQAPEFFLDPLTFRDVTRRSEYTEDIADSSRYTEALYITGVTWPSRRRMVRS